MDSVQTKNNYRFIILSVASFIFALIVYLPAPEGLTEDGKKALAIFVLCIIFWVSHVIPLMITSLLAIILFPLLGVLPAEKRILFLVIRQYSLFSEHLFWPLLLPGQV